MMYENQPCVALITGGCSGIGKAVALKLASQNINVVIADINPAGESVKNVTYRYCDITKGDDVDALYRWIAENTGMPDIVILNAGRGIHERLTEGDPDKWLDIINLNIMGTLRCIRSFVPPMNKNKQGNVIFISSVSAHQPYPYGGVYSASKAAVEMIAETLRLETLPYIKITVVAAGVTNTNFFKNQVSGHNTVEDIGMGSLSAEDVAEDVFYAISKKGTACINKIITRPIGQDF